MMHFREEGGILWFMQGRQGRLFSVQALAELGQEWASFAPCRLKGTQERTLDCTMPPFVATAQAFPLPAAIFLLMASHHYPYPPGAYHLPWIANGLGGRKHARLSSPLPLLNRTSCRASPSPIPWTTILSNLWPAARHRLLPPCWCLRATSAAACLGRKGAGLP